MVDGLQPDDGLLLLRTPEHGPASTPTLHSQAMRLTLAQNAADQILKSFGNNEKVSIRFGPRIVLQHGKSSHPVSCSLESNPSELYQRSADDRDPFYFSGKLSHRLETQRAQKDTAKADGALANLESSLKSYEAQKTSNEARFVTDRDEIRNLTVASQKGGKGNASAQSNVVRKDRLLGGLARSSPSSPFLAPGSSPALGSTSVSLPRSAASINKDQIRLNAVKIPFLHLLAVKPRTIETLRETLHASEEDCQSLLHKYAKEAREGVGKHELKDKAYKELNIWKFPYPQDAHRQTAIARTISAFDRMRINTNDLSWENLLRPDERGKAKGAELSRLKIRQGGASGIAPKRLLTKTDSADKVDSDPDVGKPDRNTDTPLAQTQSPRGGKLGGEESKFPSAKSATKHSKEIQSKASAKNGKIKARPNGKFKSSAIIEDSDEELEDVHGVGEVTAKTKESKPTPGPLKTNDQPKATLSANKPPASSPATKANGSLMPNSAVARARSDKVAQKGSPRLRADSSPQKPSPLASSPPTNATDIYDSQSGKVGGLSSTVASAVSPLGGHADATKAVSENKTISATLKRKAADQASSVAKRQQQQPPQPNGTPIPRIVENSVDSSSSARLTKPAPTLASPQRRRARLPSSSSTSSISASVKSTTSTTAHSSSLSSPVPEPGTKSNINNSNNKPSSSRTTTSPTSSNPNARSDLQLQSRRFKNLYAKYLRQHAKVTASPERQRDPREIKDLTELRDKIAKLKEDIWRQWERGGLRTSARSN